MKLFRAYIEYIKDNPKDYWFKRKVYGWGWVPATREGWLVTGAFVIFILLVAFRAEMKVTSEAGVLTEVILPVFVAAGLLIFVCYKTGEKPRWQWQIPEKYFKE